jgi:hemerythrin
MAIRRGAYASGNPLLDHQHGRLTELLRIAGSCARGHADEAAFDSAVRDYREALAEHFIVEGMIFRGAGYADAPRHCAAHANILERVDTLIDGISTLDGAAPTCAIVDELERMLFEHELLEDRNYWKAVRDMGAHWSLCWEPGLEIGIPWIDDQHRHLTAIINELSLAGSTETCGTTVAELMERFLRHSRQHFAAEERQMVEWGIPMSEHRREHGRLLEELEDLARDVGNDHSVLARHCLRFWLIDHICDDDMTDFGGRRA